MRYAISLILLSLPIALHAQDAKPGAVMIEKYLAAETDKLSAKFLDGAKTIDEWKAKRQRLYQEYMDMLGLWPIPEKTPLRAVKTAEIEAHGVVVESVHFQSKPGLYVTANVYRPKVSRERQRPEKLPAIVYVCGHSGRGRDGNKTAFQDHGFWFANHGYVCIVLDTLQLGEIAGVHHGTYGTPWRNFKDKKNEYRGWWHSIGYSPAAVECWNGVRAIDYLCTRDDVDPDKIGVTGISGGGAATFWIAAADERVKVAVPVSGMADLDYYVKQKGVNSHCDCMFLYNSYRWDWTTIAALVAPRPMLFANSDKDSIFPMDANRRVMTKLNKLYGMYGADKAVQEYVSVGGHDYRPDLRKAIFHFFNVHLKRMPTAVVEDSAKYTPLEGRKLRVFPEDKDLPKDAINARVDEMFIPAAKVALPEKGKYEEWKKGMIAKLRSCFKGWPEEVPAAVMLPVGPGGLTSMRTEADVQAQVLDGTLLGAAPTSWKVQIMDPEPPSGMLLPGLTILPRGVFVPWKKASPPNTIERSHVLLGRTIDEGRLLDVIAIRRHHLKAGLKVDSVQMVGRGQAGILAAYAALFEPSIKEVIIIDPPKSHKEGPHFLNVMRVLDIPEALGLLAPTPLTLVGGLDPAFDRTAEIYRLAGAADKLTRR